MDDVYVYLAPLPGRTKEAVMPCADGYTVYLNSNLDRTANLEGYMHALKHIIENDFEKENVQEIEAKAHKRREYGKGV